MKLDNLGLKYGTDKASNHHNYLNSYEEILSPLRNLVKVVLEIGVGAYHKENEGGSSLKMWEEFFPLAHIHGIDIYDKSKLNKGRVHTHICSQIHETQLYNLISVIGSPDLIIDDGSHVNSDIIYSFEKLFPKLKNKGVYIIEDTETSYWKEHFGGSSDIDDLKIRTSMNYFKRLTDSLNDTKFNYLGPKFDIKNISFYKGFIVIYKK